MIGRNESPSKKARFWQSFVRSLKGNNLINSICFMYFSSKLNKVLIWNYIALIIFSIDVIQDRKTSEPRRDTGHPAAVCSPNCCPPTPTANLSTTTPSAPLRGSPSPDTATCPSTVKSTATLRVPSTPTTIPAPSNSTDQVSI